MASKDILFTLERIKASDGVELCGLLSHEPINSNKGLIHLHGLAGNFYENRFIDSIVSAGIESNRRVFIFNNRGHDYISDSIVENSEGRSSLARGGAHERLAEAILDIDAAIDRMAYDGITDIAITAHSTGAVKAVIYLLKKHRPEISGLVLLSPSDDVGIQKDYAGDRFDLLLEGAKSIVKNGQGDELLPAGTFFYPIDALAYIELFDPWGIGNVFDFEGHGAGLVALEAVTVPVLVVIGSNDSAVVANDKESAARRVVEAIGSKTESEFRLVEGAGHDYAGYEGVIKQIIKNWLQKVR